jgi:hypothetical protein
VIVADYRNIRTILPRFCDQPAKYYEKHRWMQGPTERRLSFAVATEYESARRQGCARGCHNWTVLSVRSTRQSIGTAMLSFLREFGMFLRTRKRFWLVPILVMMAIFGGLIVLTQGTAVAPFIYTLF